MSNQILNNEREINNSMAERGPKVYLAPDIQQILGLGKSKTYTFLDEVYKEKNPPFRVIKIGKLFRIPKESFDTWLGGQ